MPFVYVLRSCMNACKHFPGVKIYDDCEIPSFILDLGRQLGGWDFKQCNDCMLHETIMLSINNWTLRLYNRQRKVCSSSHCLPAAQTMTGPKLLIWYGKNPTGCDRLFTQSPFMWGIPSWNVVNGHLHFVVFNSIDVDLTINLQKKWNCSCTFFLNLSNLYFISFNFVLAVYPETPPRLSSPSLFPHLWLKAVRMWHEVKMFYQSNGENSAQGQIHLRGFSTSICLAACFFFFLSFFFWESLSCYSSSPGASVSLDTHSRHVEPVSEIGSWGSS